MRYVSTRGEAPPVGIERALLDGLAPDGGLYVPERIDPWPPGDLDRLDLMPLADIAARVLAPFAGEAFGAVDLRTISAEALNFPIPLVPLEPGVWVLELFHGPTLAFKDVAARIMARLFGALSNTSEPRTVLVATSGDTGGAIAHAFAGVAGTRVVVLYPIGGVSPTQESQLTMFNGEAANVRAYAVDGTFDTCQRLVRAAFTDDALRRDVRLTSANSINIGRLLPQMIYYAHAVAAARRELAQGSGPRQRSGGDAGRTIISTPSGNFGNLTAGVMAKRLGLPIERFIAATNVNDVVPAYLATGRFEPRRSIATIANAMDVGHPSNFERLLWLYGNDLDAMRRDICGSAHTDDEVRATIRTVHDERGYLLDPHSTVGYLALKARLRREAPSGQDRPLGIVLATAHPAKFRETVEPIIGTRIDPPPALAAALARKKTTLRLDASIDALREVVGSPD